MNCPKCGYEQEERLDCLKCGVVFSKYMALQADGTGSQPGSAAVAENSASVEILELRQSVRDLGRRFSEVEFERVERGQLRGELKVLDKKVQASLDQITHRLEDLEKLLSTPQAPPPVPDGARLAEVQREIVEANVDPLAKRLSEAEERLQIWATEVASMCETMTGDTTRLVEGTTGPLTGRLDELGQRLAHLEKEQALPKDSITTEIMGRFEVRLADLESKIGSVLAARPGQDANASYFEVRLTDLENKFGLLQAPRPGQEADAAYQDVQSRLRALADELTGLKSSLDKVPQPQAELAELRQEIGKVWTQIQAVESNLNRHLVPAVEPSANEKLELDIRSIRDGMQEIRDFITRITAKA